MATRMLPSLLPADRAGGPNLSTWKRSSLPGSTTLRPRHRPTHSSITFDGPPASSGDSGLHSPLELPDPLTRVHQGTIEFRIRPTRMLDRIPRPTRGLGFTIVVRDDALDVGSYSAAMRWQLDPRLDSFGDLETRTGDPERGWKRSARLTPDVQWHEFQYSLDPNNQAAWLSVDGRPVDTELVRAPAGTYGSSRLAIVFAGIDGLLEPITGGFAFRNWQTTAHDHRRWDGG